MTVRPRYQRAFLTWLEEARPRLMLQPRLWRRSDAQMLLKFDDMNPELSVELTCYGISRGGTAYRLEVWGSSDCMTNALCFPGVDVFRTAAGYATAWTPRRAPRVWPERDAIWRSLVFEPFLDWVNTTLAQATSIAYGWRPMTVDYVTLPDDTEEEVNVWHPTEKLISDGNADDPTTFRLERIAPLRLSGRVTPWRRKPH